MDVQKEKKKMKKEVSIRRWWLEKESWKEKIMVQKFICWKEMLKLLATKAKKRKRKKKGREKGSRKKRRHFKNS